MDDIGKRLADQLGSGPSLTTTGFVKEEAVDVYVDDKRRTHVPSRPSNVPPEHVQDSAASDMNEWVSMLESYIASNEEKVAALITRIEALEAMSK